MDASRFLEALYRNAEGYAEIRLLHKSGDFRKAQKIYRPANTIHTGNFDVLAEMNREYHIYHRVNVSSTQDSKKANISQVVALYVDIDDASDAAYERLERMHFPPTAIVYSGGGFHGYWMLRQPVVIRNRENIQDIERTMQGMILAYGDNADEKAKDITRILRTPGFNNIKEKYETPLLCELVYLDDDRFGHYGYHELYKHYAPRVAPAKPVIKRQVPQTAYSQDLPLWVQEYLKTGATTGERNHRLYAAARCYLDAGKSQFEAEQDLISRALADGLSQSEAKNTINSAFRNARNPQVTRTMSARYAIGDSVGGVR